MIGLYNSVLDHLALALTSPALQDISWPAPELQHTAAKLDGKENGSAVPAPAFRILSCIPVAGANSVIRMACFWSLSCPFVLLCVQGFVHLMCFLSRSTFYQTWSHRYASKQPVPHRVVLGKKYTQVKKIITSKGSLLHRFSVTLVDSQRSQKVCVAEIPWVSK